MALSKDEREKLLAEPHVAAPAVDAGPDRAPLTVPIWYQYSPGGQPWVLTGLGSRKHKLIEAAGRRSSAHEYESPHRPVALEAFVFSVVPVTRSATPAG